MRYFLFIVFILLSACQGPTRVHQHWVKEDLNEKNYKKFFLLVLSESNKSYQFLENSFAKEIERRGKKVVKASEYSYFREIENQASSLQLLSDSLEKDGFDAILTVTILDVASERRYNPSAGMTPKTASTPGVYIPTENPSYTTFGQYTDAYYRSTQQPLGNFERYFLESNVYRVVDGSLIWSIQTETFAPETLEDLVNSKISEVFKQLKKDKIISSK
ncbi:MAG: hypothetical protein LAT68_02810 [Cyclobacteriaceae bacterium]|nr:hypothetical protein [Cyclobacteriaceae bacterium]MCH8515236.1 hypothetical protein [Cyclobacteriaceae bacterium]